MLIFISVSIITYIRLCPSISIYVSYILDGPKVRRQTATTHGGGSGESFEVGNPCPETHRYAPVSTFLERMNARLAMSHSSGQRARRGMRFSFVSFHSNAVCMCSSMVPCRPKEKVVEWARVQKPAESSVFILIFFLSAKSFFLIYFLHFTLLKIEFDPLNTRRPCLSPLHLCRRYWPLKEF